MGIEFVYEPAGRFEPYRPQPDSRYRVKLDFRVDFTNGGFVEGKGFLLDIAGASLPYPRAAEMLVSAMNLLRAGPVTIHALTVVRRGAHQDD
jgi:hypothetical protein